MAYEIAFGFGIILALVHFFSDKFEQWFESRRTGFLSFSAGISTAYLFLVLLPDLYSGVQVLNSSIFLLVLIGFTLFHLTEKFVYHHTVPIADLKHQLKEVHGITLFIYHVLLGLLLAELTQQNVLGGFLLFIPVFFHTAISTVSLEQLHDKVKYHLPARILLSISTLAGVYIASQITIHVIITMALLALVGGALFFIIIREYIPPEREGNARMYVLAIVVYTVLVFILNAKNWM